ncbi:SAM-dependent methyltransferase [Saccharopolyspora sp. K220]|uniref:SAM-dependent methyltransferase n=1 Tax=Saccharopolyspora soli TaxID=2926618 RepID=UPI001F5AB6FB|nr:SAM-dependent methyltransferase [Saccharopolyspora soli]MCI2424206.1 SAM-dependent methyltransferase [Saccharopolyspora soli]
MDRDDEIGELDLDRPNAARIYDYYLGGFTNFESDRAAAERQLEFSPFVRSVVWSNRAFLRRAVSYLIDQGIDQFLDLGSGVPTVGNVHEVAHELNPEARVAYVDVEPVAVAHARRLLGDDPRVTITQADLRHPQDVLSAPGVAGLLDFARPVAVLAVSVLHFVPDDDDPVGIMASYRDSCVRGSALAVSHISQVTVTNEQVEAGVRLYQQTSTPVTLRTSDGITALLDGYRLVEPGLVLLDQWRPESPADPANAETNNSYAAVGILP